MPSWKVVKSSAVDAFYEKSTWIPLAGAALFGATSLDKRVSDAARSHTPVFGSEQGALDTSDKLLHSSGTIFWLTNLATPVSLMQSNSFTQPAMFSKMYSFAAAGSVAVALTNGFTGEIKRLTQRARPRRTGSHDSLPSAHASSSAVLTNIARLNIHQLSNNSLLQGTADFTLGTMAGLTAWARVEGGVHYPSDVLLGIALANYFTNFVSNAFFQPASSGMSLHLMKDKYQTGLEFQLKF